MLCTSMNITKFPSLHEHLHGLNITTCLDILNQFDKFPDLYYLYFSDMELSFNMRQFASLVLLRALLLTSMMLPLTILGHLHVRGLSRLFVLGIDHNNITAISAFVNIKQLNLSRLNIITIHECTFVCWNPWKY